MSSAWALPLLIVMQTRSAGVSPRPVAWAVQSPRPATCLGAPGLWEVSKQALVAKRCHQLARGQAQLMRAPAKAREQAAALLALAPDFMEARILRGRASLRLGDSAAALQDLSLLLGETAAVSDPGALLDGGRAALAQRDLERAARFYRALGSRAALLPDRSQQVVAYLEIAGALLASESAPVDDVQAFLREARARSAGSGFTQLGAALTAVAWLAEGRAAEAQAALSEVSEPSSLDRFAASGLVFLPDGLLHAAQAVAWERERPDLAAVHYEALSRSALSRSKLGKLASNERARAGGGKAAVKRGGK